MSATALSISFPALHQSQLQQQGAVWTAAEIAQQPAIWQQLAAQAQQPQLRYWLQSLLAMPNLRIILTGAGTSAYIGQTLLPHLLQNNRVASQRIEAISTTDIVSNPAQYLAAALPTLFISYGRSGNSPESVAAVQLAEQLIPECYHLVISCNAQGQLAQFAQQQANSKLWLLPEACHDRSFAMTSSFTGMLVSTLLLLTPDEAQLQAAIEAAQALLADVRSLRQLAEQPCQRLVFLGSGCLKGIAQEAALKYLELTAGQVLSCFESPLGFRHGPKSLVDASTQLILLSSADPYTRRYDIDLYHELQQDNKALLTTQLQLPTAGPQQDVWLALPYILFAQMLAFYKALQLGISPDNPCPGGEVNRVVQGVHIYPFAAAASLLQPDRGD